MSGVRTHAESLAYAEEHNLTVVYPTASQVFVDIDSEEDLQFYEARLKILKAFFKRGPKEDKVYEVSRTPSASGQPAHLHIVVEIGQGLLEHERLCIQGLLGSDPKRELLGLMYLRKGEVNTSRFFETPDAHLNMIAQAKLVEEERKKQAAEKIFDQAKKIVADEVKKEIEDMTFTELDP